MNLIVVCLAFLGQFGSGQTDQVVPPAPAPAEAASKSVPLQPAPIPAVPLSNRFEDMKAWLLARLVVDYSFDATKAEEVSRMLDTMNDGQMRLLIAAYRDRMATQPDLPKQEVERRQKQILEQANLNKQTAEGQRDQLKRGTGFTSCSKSNDPKPVLSEHGERADDVSFHRADHVWIWWIRPVLVWLWIPGVQSWSLQHVWLRDPHLWNVDDLHRSCLWHWDCLVLKRANLVIAVRDS